MTDLIFQLYNTRFILYPNQIYYKMDSLDDITGVEKYLVLKATQARTPISASFELTPCCNLQCDMCFISMKATEVKEHGGLKDLDFWLRLAQELKEMGTLFILLTGGEPLLYPHFKELYQELKKMGFIITLNTNGTCITEEIAQLFHAYRPRRVNVTLYGASRETYEKLCHRADGFDQCMNGIRLLRQYDIDTKLNVSVVKENKHEFDEILAIGDRFGIPSEVNSYMFPCSRTTRNGMGAIDARLTAEEGGRYDALYQKHKHSSEFKEVIAATLKEAEETTPYQNEVVITCRAGKSSAWINWQGRMTPCVMMEYPAISLKEVNAKKAWKNLEEMMKELPAHSDCKGCKLWKLCQACYASVSLEKEHNGNVSYLCRFTQCEYDFLKQLINK